MSIEIKDDKIMKDPKIHKAILGIKVEIKKRAQTQKEIRLAKRQKNPHERAKITALHRMHLELRGKDPESHHLPVCPSFLYDRAQRYARSIHEKYELEQ